MKKIAWLIATQLFASPLWAADLMQVYRAAQDNDPSFAAARATLDAGREKVPQARSGLLPSLVAGGNTTWNETQYSVLPGKSFNYNSNAYQLTLTQPLFRWQNWLTYDQAKLQVAQAEANFELARQDLILRSAQAYFDVLYAQENLTAVRASKQAIAQQLELAKKSFEVGTATITDTHEAQARYDLAVAQEIAGENDLEVKRRALQAVIGNEPEALAGLRGGAEPVAPQPAEMAPWVTAAEKDSLSVQVQQANAAIAEREVEKQRAGHYPTVDLVANGGHAKSLAMTGVSYQTDFTNAGIQVNIPLFVGGAVVSREREAAANRNAAQSALEATRRGAALAARQYYLGVTNGLAQVRALKAGLASSQLALESNKLGYDVGVRINIDVLNAENQVYMTRRDLARATFDTLMAQLRLKAAAGSLGEDDVAQINALLDPNSAR